MKISISRKSAVTLSFAFAMALPSVGLADQKNFREAADACMQSAKPPALPPTPGTAPSLEPIKEMEDCMKKAGFEAPPAQDMGQMKELKAPERAPASLGEQINDASAGQQ